MLFFLNRSLNNRLRLFFDIDIKNLLKPLNEQNIELEIDESARKYVTKVGFNAHYGARPILGIIRKEIRRPLSKLIISGDINAGDKVTMKYVDEKKQISWDIDTPDNYGKKNCYFKGSGC